MRSTGSGVIPVGGSVPVWVWVWVWVLVSVPVGDQLSVMRFGPG